MSTTTAPVNLPAAQNVSSRATNGMSTTIKNGAGQISAASSTSSELTSISATSAVSASHEEYSSTKIETKQTVVIATAEAEFARLMSEIPWMRFQITATPDAAWLKEERFKAVFQKLTQKTAKATSTKVFEQIHKETKTMLERLAMIEEDINMTSVMEEIHREFAGGACGALTNPEALAVGHAPCHECGRKEIPEPAPLLPQLSDASWIWTQEAAKNPEEPPAGARGFFKSFVTPEEVDSVVIDITIDDFGTLYINGKLVGSSTVKEGTVSWKHPQRYTVSFEPTKEVRIAVWAVQAETWNILPSWRHGDGYAGLIAAGVARNSKKSSVAYRFNTDGSWKTQLKDTPKDNLEKFSKALKEGVRNNDSSWKPAYVYKTNLWGPLQASEEKKWNGKVAGIKGIAEAPDAAPATVL